MRSATVARMKREFDSFLLVQPPNYFLPIKDYLVDSGYDFEGTKILEFGCGTGGILPHFICQNTNRLVGIDISNKTIEYARKNSSEKIEFICGDLNKRDSIDSFDLIVSHSTLQYVEDLVATLDALRQNLVSGGTLVATLENRNRLSVLNIAQHINLFLLPEWLKTRLHFFWKLINSASKIDTGDKEILEGKSRYFCIPAINIITEGDLGVLLEEAGFTDIRITNAPNLHVFSTPHYLIEAVAK